MALLPLGKIDTIPNPALILEENDTSFVVMVIAELVEEIVPLALVTLPVPSADMVTPIAPLAL